MTNQKRWDGCDCDRRAGRALAGLASLTALSLAISCGEDGVAQGATLASLSASELRTLCEEIRTESGSVGPRQCGPESYVQLQANPGPCDSVDAVACNATVSELRACAQAASDDLCGRNPDTNAACAPLRQRGCLPEASAPWAADCPELGAAVAPFEGIYEVSRHTANASACDADGNTVFSALDQPFFVVVAVELFGSPAGWIESCDSLADCRAAAEELSQQGERAGVAETDGARAPNLSALLVCDAALDGALASSQSLFDLSDDRAACSVELKNDTVTRAQDGALRVEQRTLTWRKALDAAGGCAYSPDADPVPEGTPCRLDVREAAFVSAL